MRIKNPVADLKAVSIDTAAALCADAVHAGKALLSVCVGFDGRIIVIPPGDADPATLIGTYSRELDLTTLTRTLAGDIAQHCREVGFA